VQEVRPDLILEVRDGTKSVEAAYAEAFPAPVGSEVRDVLGRLVPPALADAFRDRERFLRAQRLVRELTSEIGALATGPGGTYFQPEAAACRDGPRSGACQPPPTRPPFGYLSEVSGWGRYDRRCLRTVRGGRVG
jgi:hypothetical protein